MAEWYRFRPVKFQRKTMHLTLEEDCVYRRLIDWYMTSEEQLPDNDQALASIARIGLADWQRMSPAVRPFFSSTPGGKLANKTCEEELRNTWLRRDEHAHRARNAAMKRWKRQKSLDATGMPEAMLGASLGHDEKRGEEKRDPPDRPVLGDHLSNQEEDLARTREARRASSPRFSKAKKGNGHDDRRQQKSWRQQARERWATEPLPSEPELDDTPGEPDSSERQP
jgi:uncharacterized protein YdaU (DUF1376 family)